MHILIDTPGYKAPKSYNDDFCTFKVDVFAFGMILYEFYTDGFQAIFWLMSIISMFTIVFSKVTLSTLFVAVWTTLIEFKISTLERVALVLNDNNNN